MSEECLVKAAVKEGKFFESDQQYLDAYAGIFPLIMEHYRLWEETVGEPSRGYRRPRDQEGELAQMRLGYLNRTMQEREWLFWEKVDASCKAGRRFVVEEAAAHYKLSHFEKRVLLVFLCGELRSSGGFEFSRQSIINALDFDNSMVTKIKNSACLNADSPLLRNRILIRSSHCGDNEFKLAVKFLGFVSKRLDGKKGVWPKEDAGDDERDDPESTGYIKKPEIALDRVVLDKSIKEKLRFFLEVHQSKQFKKLGVDKAIKNSKGLTFLFYGPPGTGKTMLAEAIAHTLGRKLLVAETPKIFNMYLGETDKNIAGLFRAAHKKKLVLLIDEADSLVYSRGIASSDFKVRFVNVMLTEIERFEGIVILTTNMDKILDPALERRIALKVKFELPTPSGRLEIWQKHIPQGFGLAPDVDFMRLAAGYEFAGGNIKNAVLSAIRKAVFRKDEVLTMQDLVFGAELEKEGMLSLKNKEKVLSGFAV